MAWGIVAGAAVGAVGSAVAANSASDAADAQAQSQRDTAAQAADAAKFRPVGITSRFGSSRFAYDTKGNLTNKAGFNEAAYLAANPDVAAQVRSGQIASGQQHYETWGQQEGRQGASYADNNATGYSVSPELAAMRDNLLSQAGGWGQNYGNETLINGVGLTHIGEQYLQSPDQAAASWMARQQNLLAPSRERQLADLRNSVFQNGREGLAVGATGTRPDGSAGLSASNPEMEAYYNSLAQQDATLASQAQAEGRAQTQFGVGLVGSGNQMMTSAFAPMSNWLGTAGTIEQMGQSPLDISAQLGGRSATAGATGAQMLMQGGMAAANTLGSVAGYNPYGATLQGVASNPRIQGMFSQYMQPSTNYAGSAGGWGGAYSDYGMASGANGAWV